MRQFSFASTTTAKYPSYDALREQVVGRTVAYPKTGSITSASPYEGVVTELLQTNGRYTLLIQVGDQFTEAGITTVEFK